MTTGLRERPAAAPDPRSGVLTAVVLATAPGPAALQRWEGGTLLGRVLGQLGALGVADLRVIARPAWSEEVARAVGAAARVQVSPGPAGDLRAVAAIAREAADGLLVAHGDILTHGAALAGLLRDRRLATAVLTGPIRRFAPRVRLRRKRVMSAASPYHAVHDPDAAFLGVLKVAGGDRAALAAVAERLAALLEPSVPAAWEEQFDRRAGIWRRSLARATRRGKAPPANGEEAVRDHLAAAREDVPALLLTGLVRDGHGVGSDDLRELFWARPLSGGELAAAAEELGRADEDRALLDSAVKANDGFFTTFFVSPYSRFIARWAARRGLTPNQVTTASMLIGVVAAAAFATGGRWGLIAGAVLLQLSFTTDCVDGQLARYTRSFSQLGAWLDSIFDRAKEYLVFAGLAIGAARAGDPVWLLAASALTLQTVRHMVDFSFSDEQGRRADALPRPPLEEPGDRPGAVADEGEGEEPEETGARKPLRRRALTRLRRFERNPAVLWPRKMIAFPIGERFAVISLTAALFTPRTTFTVLLAWGGVAAAYTLFGRMLRALAWTPPSRLDTGADRPRARGAGA